QINSNAVRSRWQTDLDKDARGPGAVPRPGLRHGTGHPPSHARSENDRSSPTSTRVFTPIVTPVDYKRGAVPDVPERAWEPERVQLCAQGLILRENGYRCDEGVLYFVQSKTRVTIPFDEALCDRVREIVAEMRE